MDDAARRQKIFLMRSDGLLKHLAISAVIAVVFYAAVFGWIEHRRTFKGPWLVEFRSDSAGVPAIVVSQKYFQISETIRFPGQTVGSSNLSRAVVFGPPPAPDLPFGNLVFQDPTFLPGTVTLSLFGHQVEIFPRAFSIDKKEYRWETGAAVEVNSATKGQ